MMEAAFPHQTCTPPLDAFLMLESLLFKLLFFLLLFIAQYISSLKYETHTHIYIDTPSLTKRPQHQRVRQEPQTLKERKKSHKKLLIPVALREIPTQRWQLK